ncbi:methionyl-tRNA formyltransferase [Ureaplasma miroungigenitalium]|uniref:Methionyl-tRNA formyltransferase n=1 Tax=Ureaplasma miroungigenitalium TaxID=1042321 RepID=A0ABT3BM12_9BACT|nr:methionyl-tRNA formyltransferase [Ureaplasma miroungigenitalium]MCV3728291.1 methionyl-tRNA formyltransferase [Ureaplasma miroungigenitalium]MCV3734096.1 methionyl-tRNA formyltransferase [Ureaplasma miroungigenitalium]
MIKAMFFGTPEIAVEILKTVHHLPGVEIMGVVSQPDKMRNRKNALVMTPVKQYCVANNLLCLAPAKINDIYEEIKALAPDIIITCAYGQFIPQRIIDIPTYKIVNVHASLLPKLRGGAPIHYAILNGYQTTGVTLMHTIKQMDAGNILFTKSTSIDETTTYASLLQTLTQLGVQLIQEHFFDLCQPDLVGIPQDMQAVSYAFNIQKNERYINFHQQACLVNRFVNALNDKPVALMTYHDTDFKVYRIKISQQKSVKQPGTIFYHDKQLLVSTSDFDVILDQIQLPNKNISYVHDVLNGKSIFDDLKKE